MTTQSLRKLYRYLKEKKKKGKKEREIVVGRKKMKGKFFNMWVGVKTRCEIVKKRGQNKNKIKKYKIWT